MSICRLSLLLPKVYPPNSGMRGIFPSVLSDVMPVYVGYLSVPLPMVYRSGTLNSNTVNLKFHLIRSFFEIFARLLSFHV